MTPKAKLTLWILTFVITVWTQIGCKKQSQAPTSSGPTTQHNICDDSSIVKVVFTPIHSTIPYFNGGILYYTNDTTYRECGDSMYFNNTHTLISQETHSIKVINHRFINIYFIPCDTLHIQIYVNNIIKKDTIYSTCLPNASFIKDNNVCNFDMLHH